VTDDRPIVNFEGELVALGPIRRDLVPIYQQWMNDFEVTRTLALFPSPMTDELEQKWYESTATNSEQPIFTVYERATMRPIGTTSLQVVDWVHRRAEWGIAIGEADARGKGYGTETAHLMLDYAFTALGLNSVSLHVYEFNFPARKAYANAGFIESGRMRQARWYAGRFWDVILMDCLASEFESPVLRRIFTPDIQRP
jgi:RimJ/RimL family protein N-acetyltransferase